MVDVMPVSSLILLNNPLTDVGLERKRKVPKYLYVAAERLKMERHMSFSSIVNRLVMVV